MLVTMEGREEASRLFALFGSLSCSMSPVLKIHTRENLSTAISDCNINPTCLLGNKVGKPAQTTVTFSNTPIASVTP